ncbi:hypothetical protein ACSBR2_008916 [Camellia fascicularis]
MEEAKLRGWIPVGRTSFFTIFVDNIPRSVNPKGLYNIFSKFGVVNDVFISQKRRKLTNTRFGFVRFDCSVAATVAVQKVNGLWVDDTAIEVKHVAFGKEKVEGQGATGPLRLQATRYNDY